MQVADFLLVAILAVLFPAWELWRGPSLRSRLMANPGLKISTYRTTCLQLWVPTLLLLALYATGSLSIVALPLLVRPNAWQLAALALLLLLTLYLASTLRRVARDRSIREQTAQSLEPAAWMLPVDRREVLWFIGPVSFSAGVCEELLYRGFLLQWMDLYLPTWTAMLLSSAIFGLMHAYQGPSGIARSAAMGLVLATVFVLTESLLVPILLHVLVDVYAGALSWIVLRDERTSDSDPPARDAARRQA